VSIGERVRAGRKALHLSQEEVARRAGVSLNQVNRLERGEIVDPHFSTLAGLASALDMQISELVGEPSLPLGDGDAPQARRTGALPTWALTPDMDLFRRRISEKSTDTLRDLAMQLVGGELPQTSEDLREDPAARAAVAVNFTRAMIVRDELVERGEDPPENFLLVLRRHMDALGLREQSASEAKHHEEPGLQYLRAWRAFLYKLVNRWEEEPPSTAQELSVVLDTMQALIDEGAFERPPEEITTASWREAGWWLELQLLFRGIEQLNRIADTIEANAEAERRRSAFREIQGRMAEGRKAG
jgi:transcriptional regulator with XRE-family HTH domain